MKKHVLALLLSASLLFLPFAALNLAGCNHVPSERTTEVKTLKIIGASADASMKLAAQLLADGKISRAQWDKVALFFDTKFQPAFGLAVTAVKSDLSGIASPDIVNLAAQLASLVASYIPEPKTK